MLANLLSARSPVTPRKKSLLQLEALEDRLVPSWTGVPPSAIVPSAGAVAVSLSGTAAEGDAAVTANEVDYYTFLAPTSGTYTLSATTPASGLDPVLGVFGSGGQRLAYNDDV